MTNFETSRNEGLIDTKPMFASTWMVLFTELRKNYTERHIVDFENKENIQTKKQKHPGLK